MIYFFTPYSFEYNLGKAYNDYCKLIPNDDDWIVVKDGDIMFLGNEWGKQFQVLADKYPNAGIITCITNRTSNPQQMYKDEISENADIRYHRQIALHLQNTNYDIVTEAKLVISGHVMMFKKSTWREAKFFPEFLSEKGVLKYNKNIATVDNRFSSRVMKTGKKILVSQGIYALHYYRLNEGAKYRNHLGLKNAV